MNLLLGIRMAFAGGRESAVRMGLMAVGVAMGMVLLMLTLCAMPVLQSHIDRLAWRRTTVMTPATAPDAALWLAVTDRYAGHDVIRVHVAALGPRPPLPPGVERLPGPGEVVVSPALAEMMRSVPDDELRNRFPGRVVGTIGPEGLIMPAELVGIVGHTPDEMHNTHGAMVIRGLEQPGDKLDLAEFWRILIGMVAVLIIGPVVVFVAMTTRIGGPRRERRFAALRLAGATRLQTAVLAASETGAAALAGSLLGLLAFLAMRPLIAGFITLGHGMPIFVEDLAAPTGQVIALLVAVPLFAIATTLVAVRPVQINPLGSRHQIRRRGPKAWRLLPVALGILGTWYSTQPNSNPDGTPNRVVVLLSILAPLSVLVGLFLTGPWVCMWISRGMARLSRNAATLIVARRIAADPYSTFRSVSGAALAMFVATSLGIFFATERTTGPERRSVLDPGVVAIHVFGAPEASLAPLMTEGVVIARIGSDGAVVVSCADLERVSEVTCPLPLDSTHYDNLPQIWELFILPEIYNPSKFVEPGPDAAQLRVQTLFVPTDGTLAGEERLRTLAAIAVPGARTQTNRDLAAHSASSIGTWAAVVPGLMFFVLVVAACSLTVSAIAGVMERRRPFALLRAAGAPLWQLRRVVLLETGVPLLLTVLGGVGVAFLMAYAATPPGDWIWPEVGFFLGLGAGVLGAFLVSSIALPLMNAATRHDSVRFE